MFRIRKYSSSSLAVAAAAGLLGTGFGLGAVGQAPDIFDGSGWLWSRPVGEVARANGNSGVVDLRQQLPGSQGNQVRVTQSGEFLLVHDLEAGVVSSVDLSRMSIAGTVEAAGDVAVLLSGEDAVVVDRTRGLVRVVDPVTLQLLGDPVQLVPGLVGGGFDESGGLWLGVPSQGTVVQLRVRTGQVVVEQTVPVAEPGHDLAVSVRDDGVLVADRSADRLVTVAGGQPVELAAPVPLASALVPDRTVGELAVVTVPEQRALVVVDGDELRQLSLPAGGGVAVPFAGRVYVPDDAAGVVHVLAPDGRELPVIELARARGPLELEVRQGLLFINAVDSPTAAVVAESGEVRAVDKFDPDATLPVPDDEQPEGPTRPTHPSSPVEPPSKQPPPGPPGPPAEVTVQAGDAQVEVGWDEAVAPGGAGVDRYLVSWDGDEEVVDGDDELSIVATGLGNGEEYTFRVVAENEFGQGPPVLSEPVTPFSVPDAPGDLVAELAGDSDVRISWSEPDGNGRPIDHYVVRDGDGGELAETGDTELTLTAEGLTEVSVAAVNDAGEGAASTAEVPLPPEPEPSALSVEITDVRPLDSSLRVSFAVDNSGGEQPTCTVTVGGDSQDADCEGFRILVAELDPDTSYTVEVTASAGGDSDSAQAEFITYPRDDDGVFECEEDDYCTENGAPSFLEPSGDIGDAFMHHAPGDTASVVCRVTGPTFDASQYGGAESDQWFYMDNSATYAPLGFVNINGELSEIPQCTH